MFNEIEDIKVSSVDNRKFSQSRIKSYFSEQSKVYSKSNRKLFQWTGQLKVADIKLNSVYNRKFSQSQIESYFSEQSKV